MDRGIAAFIIGASLIRQFEFAQNVWINDKTFHELGNEHDPICGTQDGTLEFKIQKRPIRKVLEGLPAFTTLAFQELAEEATGHPVAVFQRIDQAGYRLPIDERILADTDTLMVFGLDHVLSEQEAAFEEVAAIIQWLGRERTCLPISPNVRSSTSATVTSWYLASNASGNTPAH